MNEFSNLNGFYIGSPQGIESSSHKKQTGWNDRNKILNFDLCSIVVVVVSET